MSVVLLGPVPVDPQGVDRSARALLDSYKSMRAGERVARPLEAATGKDPGLHLMLRDDKVAGFWVTLGVQYVDDGPSSATVPPYARDLLDALVEEVWWDSMAVTPLSRGRWTPLIVLEYLAVLAERASIPPPGVYYDAAAEYDEEEVEEGREEGQWLDPLGVAHQTKAPRRIPTAKLEWLGLPEARGVLTLIQGDLRRVSTRHDGSFRLVVAPEPEAVSRTGRPLEDLLDSVAGGGAALPDQPELGHPIRLSEDRAAFPLTGWLTRELDTQPTIPSSHEVVPLPARDVRSQLVAQTMLAIGITMMVFFGVFGLLQAIHEGSRPRQQQAQAPREAEAQPALSVCSADHDGFVKEFRCQLSRLNELEGEDLRGLKLRTLLGTECDDGTVDPDLDLFPTYCGVRDRTQDLWFQDDYEWSKVVAAQACHEVLKRPYTHKRPDAPALADPHKYFVSEADRVSALVDLVDRLDSACQDVRLRMRKRIGGAILASHVGSGNADESGALRDLAFEYAAIGLSEEHRTCLNEGGRFGVGSAPRLHDVCGPDAAPKWSERVAEEVADVLGPADPLDIDDEVSAILEYSRARFVGRSPGEDLWACHWQLSADHDDKGYVRIEGGWSQSVVGPTRYGSGLVRSQFQLDGVLQKLRGEGEKGAVCWSVVDGLLGAYEPVHPLLAEIEEGGWPASDQQACAQACAVAYRLEESSADANWKTRWTDVARCTSAAAIDDRPEKALKRLDLPWNASSDGTWVDAAPADVCAFHLVAQGYLPEVLGAGQPALWAGEEVKGVAGGPGDAYQAATALDSYGRNRSSVSCGNVAVQCFGSLLLDVTSRTTASTIGARDREEVEGREPGGPAFEPHQWRAAFLKQVSEVPSWEVDTLERHPWCRLVRPYLSEDLSLPEGQLDFPCAQGVRVALQRYETVLGRVAAGGTEG